MYEMTPPLLDRLKPSVAVRMEEAKKEYPTVIEAIEEELRTNWYVTELRYRIIIWMKSYLDLESAFDAFNENATKEEAA